MFMENNEQFLKKMLEMQKDIQKRLRHYPPGKLVVYRQTTRGKTYDTFRMQEPTGKLVPIGKKKTLIRALAEKRFLEEKLELVRENIDKAAMIQTSYVDLSYAAVLQRLPQEIQPFVTIENRESLRLPVDPVQAQHYVDWAKAPYRKNTRYTEHLRHRTSDGTLVRSKSEVIIYEQLRAAGLAFRYEEPVVIDRCDIFTDFQVLTPGMKLWYWEHCGMMNDPNYRKELQWKLQMYEKAGIVLWDNLILTFDDAAGNLDVQIIRSEIENKLLQGVVSFG